VATGAVLKHHLQRLQVGPDFTHFVVGVGVGVALITSYIRYVSGRGRRVLTVGRVITAREQECREKNHREERDAHAWTP
jgi:hypothetical protein